jgi:hypothetical protein
MLIWILVAYLGYWAGVELARRHVEFPIDDDWMQKIQSKLTDSRQDSEND